jgi:coenzyme F420 hydrogenase subunit beta
MSKVSLQLNGQIVEAEENWTILETAKFLGIDIPTLCYDEGLTTWGGCRLCVVEIGEGKKRKLVSSCTYRVEEGLIVNTHSLRVIKTRRMLIEILLAICHKSKTVQDLASKFGVKKVRFKIRNEDCIYCGRCVRICSEQMKSGAIGFINRGGDLKISTPFNRVSDVCRRCGACMYICPVCELRCDGPNPSRLVCGGCENLTPTCTNIYDDLLCFMGAKGQCGTCIGRESKNEGDNRK